MAVTISIGRTSGLYVAQSGQGGDALNLEGHLLASTSAGMVAALNQLNGLAPGEIVPVVDSNHPERDGFYRVLSAGARRMKPTGADTRGRWSVSLVRLSGFTASAQEVVYTAAARQTTYDPATQGVYVWLPSDAEVVDGHFPGTVADRGLTATSSSRLSTVGTTNDLDNGSTSGIVSFYVAPEDFYDASAVIETNTEAGYLPVVGTQIPPSPYMVKERVSSGVMRVSWNWSTGVITVAVLDETDGWETLEETFELTCSATGDTAPFDDHTMVPTSARVVRNDVDCVAVRYTATINALGGNCAVTITMNRGAFHADIRVESVDTGYDLVRLGPTADETCTAPNAWSVVQSSNDVSGNRYALATSFVGATLSTTRGDINLDMAGSPVSFALVAESDGSSASAANTAAAVIGQWWTGLSTSQRTVML